MDLSRFNVRVYRLFNSFLYL